MKAALDINVAGLVAMLVRLPEKELERRQISDRVDQAIVALGNDAKGGEVWDSLSDVPQLQEMLRATRAAAEGGFGLVVLQTVKAEMALDPNSGKSPAMSIAPPGGIVQRAATPEEERARKMLEEG